MDIIFDMDGVIFDTERMCIRAWREAGPEFGFPSDDAERVFRSCIGTNMARTRALTMADRGADFPFDAFSAACSRRFHETADTEGIPLLKGARECLAWLSGNGARIGLASSTREAAVRKELADAGLLRHFDAVVGGDMVAKSKPEPDIYLATCAALGADPARTFAVEDSHNGVRAAARAGMRVLMVPDMLQPTDEMRGLAEAILPDLFAVRDYLSAL